MFRTGRPKFTLWRFNKDKHKYTLKMESKTTKTELAKGPLNGNALWAEK